MPTFMSQTEGWLIFLVFAIAMIGLVWLGTRPQKDKDDHLLASRNVGTVFGAFSIAVSWIWAPAVFVCSQKSYQQGMAGIFWFTVPNILCFFTFAPLALRLRRLMPQGYSLPDFIARRFPGNKPTHLIFTTIILAYDLGAIVSNALAGGTLMHTLSGIDLHLAILGMTGVAASYAVWRAMPASIITDFIQMSVILLVAFVLVPWSVSAAGGWHIVTDNLAGTSGSANVFDPWIAYSFGIPVTLGLISGPVADQMFYQRVMSARYHLVVRTFVIGGLVFGIVPIILSILGFIGASSAMQNLHVSDPQMISVAVVQHLLPKWTLFLFALMVLCATLDSAYIAIGSLWSIDIFRRYQKPKATDKEIIATSKKSMLVFAIAGTAIAMWPNLKILWVFLIGGVLASAALAPAIFSLFWKRLTARGAFWAAFLSFMIDLPTSVYANLNDNPHLLVASSLLSVIIGLLICLSDGFFNRKKHFNFKNF
jgi:Na+/proline symporter